MSQLARISRGVRAELRNHQSMFLIEKRASSTYHGLPNYWLKKSNPWKVVSPSSYLNPNGITNPRPPFLPSSSSLPYTTSTDKDGVTSKGKDDQVNNAQLDYDKPEYHLIDGDDQVNNAQLDYDKPEYHLIDGDDQVNNAQSDYDEPEYQDNDEPGLIEGVKVLSKVLSKVLEVLSKGLEGWDWFPPKHSKHAQNSFQNNWTRSYTTVHKQTTAYGMLVDLTRYNGFDELISRLDEIFRFNGELMSPSNSWLVLFTDNEGYYNVVEGDLDWEDFCNRVCKIFIYTREEVDEMSPCIFRTLR